MRLSDVDPGSLFTVSAVRSGGEIGKRLADMGFTDGAEGILVRGAFMRGPLQVRIRGYDLLIRRGEGAMIEVRDVVATGSDLAAAQGQPAPPEADLAASARDFVRPAGSGSRLGRRGFMRGLFAADDCCTPGHRRHDARRESDR